MRGRWRPSGPACGPLSNLAVKDSEDASKPAGTGVAGVLAESCPWRDGVEEIPDRRPGPGRSIPLLPGRKVLQGERLPRLVSQSRQRHTQFGIERGRIPNHRDRAGLRRHATDTHDRSSRRARECRPASRPAATRCPFFLCGRACLPNVAPSVALIHHAPKGVCIPCGEHRTMSSGASHGRFSNQALTRPGPRLNAHDGCDRSR
ncbi:MAG: hypothetical protein JWO67_4469 [Streptosporangiaceae bacterium]|nr:hypothetical protein [Streptosporangiaceae bacterium]